MYQFLQKINLRKQKLFPALLDHHQAFQMHVPRQIHLPGASAANQLKYLIFVIQNPFHSTSR